MDILADCCAADIQSLFALAGRFDDRAIHLDRRLPEKRLVFP
jgi:hypothetical protein